MNVPLLLCAAVLAADAAPVITQNTFYDAQTHYEASIRGQAPGETFYEDDPLPTMPAGPTFAPPAGPYDYDPFLGAAPPPGGPMFDAGMPYAAVGSQPYRFGWSSRYDIAWLPAEGVRGGGARGDFEIFEFNAAWRNTMGWPTTAPQLIFSWTPEFNYRSWQGPSRPDLPPNVFRFGSDFELATPGNAPVSGQLGFTPAFVSDLRASPDADAFNWDARGVIFLRASPQLLIALGAAYWDRVDNIIIPYAGVVWTPNDYWELRLLFPKSRISYFLGNWWGGAAWAYAGLEYNVEAYQIDLRSPSGRDERIQYADYRALFGLRTDGGGVTGFVDVGWAFARDVEFEHGTPGFDVNTGFVGRMGLRF